MSPPRLPLVVSVPHGGVRIPPEVAEECLLQPLDSCVDGDTWARELYDLRDDVLVYVDTGVPRAIVDMNRAPEDLPSANPDGVVKTFTLQSKQVWQDANGPSAAVTRELFCDYHRPYHEALERASRTAGAVLGIDCHTMLARNPHSSSRPGAPRPLVCISNRGNERGESSGEPLTAPTELVLALRDAFAQQFRDETAQDDFAEPRVRVNDPFTGGYVTQRQAAAGPIPWIQLELSRALYLPLGWTAAVVPDGRSQGRLRALRDRIVAALTATLLGVPGIGEQPAGQPPTHLGAECRPPKLSTFAIFDLARQLAIDP